MKLGVLGIQDHAHTSVLFKKQNYTAE